MQHGSILLLQRVSDGERAAHTIHWSDGLQRHRKWSQGVCTNVTSVCCPLQPNFGVCIVGSDKIETTFLSMFFVSLCIRKPTSPNTERYWSVIDIQFPEMLNWGSLWGVEEWERTLLYPFTTSTLTLKTYEFKPRWWLQPGSPNKDEAIIFNHRLSAAWAFPSCVSQREEQWKGNVWGRRWQWMTWWSFQPPCGQ